MSTEITNDAISPNTSGSPRRIYLWIGGLLVVAAIVGGITVAIVKSVNKDATPAATIQGAPKGNIADNPTVTPTVSTVTLIPTTTTTTTLPTTFPTGIPIAVIPTPMTTSLQPTTTPTTPSPTINPTLVTLSPASALQTLLPSKTTKTPSLRPATSTPTMSPTTFTPTMSPTTFTPTMSPTDTTLRPSVTTEPPTFTVTITGNTTAATPKLGAIDGIAYYYCPAQSQDNVHHLVLLHGGSYTKEEWKDIGILDQFCATPQVSVTALDLSTSADSETLKRVLNSLDASVDLILSKPVVLVTPSASGKTVTDWIMNGNASEIPEYIEVWVPIATGSLVLASDAQVESLIPLPVLAINGDRDTAGGKYSQRLATLVGAKAVELQGGHPVYLQSPDEFVQEILVFLGIL